MRWIILKQCKVRRVIGEEPVTDSFMLWSIIEDKPKTNAVEEARPVIQFVTSLKFDLAMAEQFVKRGFIGLHIARDDFCKLCSF
jgi:hypothetical protein